MKTKILALLVVVTIVLLSLCSCGDSKAKSSYIPPAEVFDVMISGTSEPEIDGVRFTYDSKARIDTVTFTIDGYEYKQQYSYDDPAQIVIKTIYQTEVIEEKVIRYVDIPVDSGFTTLDGYFICITDDELNKQNSNKDIADNHSIIKATLEKGVWIEYSWQSWGFEALYFTNGIVTWESYMYSDSEIRKINTRIYDYTINDCIITIHYDDYDYSWEMLIPEDKMTRSFEDFGNEMTVYMYHHDSIPSIETIQEEAYIKVY